jgi:hypothetical protein
MVGSSLKIENRRRGSFGLDGRRKPTEREIQRLEHERQILLQSGTVSFAVEIQEVDALLAKAKKLMRGAK